MDVIKKMKPGEPGTKRLLSKYGEQLICVRYRGDGKQKRRITTVELVVDEGFYIPLRKSTPAAVHQNPNRNVYIRIDYHETELRQKARHAGGQWIPEKKRWQIRYRDARNLGLNDRIEDICDVDI